MNTPNKLVELWVHHCEDRGVMDGQGYPVARPGPAGIPSSEKITVWTSKEAVLAFCKKKKMLAEDKGDVVEVTFPGEVSPFTKAPIPPLRFTKLVLSWD